LARAGELYALCTAVCWAGTAMFFAAAGQRIGSLVVNFLRLLVAFAALAIWGALRRDMPLPLDATDHAWLWLSLSGIVGFTLGDLCLFRAFVLLGPRLSTLVMSTAPLFAATIGFVALGETLDAIELLGMALTLAGVAWAVLDRRPRVDGTPPTSRGKGILLAFGGALGQAGGLVMSKYGMGDYDAFASTQIRIIAGGVGFAILYTVIGWWPRVWAARRDGKGLGLTALGSIVGPFLGVSLSLLAVQNTETGVAASIMATTPIIIIPIAVWVQRDRVGLGGVAGAILAVCGVALLFR
jgi:drug/metabolite transporter (DMT)-like permease